MKSPKFRLRKQDLEKVITAGNIKSTWKSIVRDAMRRQFIEDPIEFLDVNLNLDSVSKDLATQVASGDYTTYTPLRLLSEKSKGLCRQIVVPHPYDCLILQCLSNNLYPHLKSNAQHSNAFYQPDRGFGSKVANKTGYSALQAWLDFQKKILEFSKTHPIVVVTDIANFYDCVSYAQLRNILSNFVPDQKEAILDLTLHILGSMLWQPDYMPRVEAGLPQIDLEAPRLLAHTFLYELDRFMKTTAKVDYARYMDDIDIGIDTTDNARLMLRDIDLTLHSRQVRLNAGKTKILTGDEISAHFKVKENMFLGVLFEWIENNPTKIGRGRMLLSYLLRRWERNKIFDDGNGEKILKRLLNRSSYIGSDISEAQILKMLRTRPGVREEIFRYTSRSLDGNKFIPSLIDFIRSNAVIDDATALLFSYSVVELKFQSRSQIRKKLAETGLWMCQPSRSNSWIYAGLWILSKYGNEKQIWNAISRTYSRWQSDYRLGRMVAGLHCVLHKRQSQLYELIRSSRNQGASEVIDFFDRIHTDVKATLGIMNYLTAPNTSYPNKSTHAKWLVVLTVLRSSAVPAGTRLKLRKIHFSALNDRSYAIRARALT